MKHDVLIGDELLRVSSWCSLASVTRAPGLMNHLKAAAWAGDWLLVSFVNITWPVSRHVQRGLHTRVQYGRSLSIQNIQFLRRHVNAEQEWPLLCSVRPVLLCRVLRGQLRGCRARGQAGEERGSGMLLMQTEFIYQLSIALISLKTKTLLPTNLQANKFCISCAGEKNWTNKKTVKLSSIVIVYRICFQDSPMPGDGLHFGSGSVRLLAGDWSFVSE